MRNTMTTTSTGQRTRESPCAEPPATVAVGERSVGPACGRDLHRVTLVARAAAVKTARLYSMALLASWSALAIMSSRAEWISSFV
jgi:hypothetical protein